MTNYYVPGCSGSYGVMPYSDQYYPSPLPTASAYYGEPIRKSPSTIPKLVKCEYCGSGNKRDNSFCSQCGAPMWEVLDPEASRKDYLHAKAIAEADWRAIERIRNE